MTLKLLYQKINPVEYLSLAKNLSSQLDIAALRSAADRAYYASFLTCRENLRLKGYIVPYNGIDEHEYISRTLRTVIGSLGNDENRLRRARNEITYNTNDLIAGQNDVMPLEWILKTASELITSVEALPQKFKSQ